MVDTQTFLAEFFNDMMSSDDPAIYNGWCRLLELRQEAIRDDTLKRVLKLPTDAILSDNFRVTGLIHRAQIKELRTKLLHEVQPSFTG